MVWCLKTELVDDFKKMLVSGELTPEKLNNMTSDQRRALFSDRLGGLENAKKINTLFEKKLLLKNTKQGMISWAKSVMKGETASSRDIISRIRKMDERILDPKEQEIFLSDLASKKLGIDITFDQAKEITELSHKIDALSEKDLTNRRNRIEYGESIIDLEEHLHKIAGKKMSVADNIYNVVNLPRTVMTTADLSAPLRQGWGMMSRKEFYSSFKEMFKYAISEKAYKELRADIITRETFDLMKKGKLRITKMSDKLTEREEAYMSNLLDKVPIIRGSERAYLGFLNKLRADVFDNLYYAARQKGVIGKDIKADEKIIKDIAEVVNNFTGAGNIGKHDRYGGAALLLNAILFSPRKTIATINKFNPVKYAQLSSFARKEALRQLMGSLTISATVIALAVAFFDADFEWNPTSADFGKIKLGDTRIDVSGGEASYMTLLARLATGTVKSSTTGLTRELGRGFGKQSRYDIAAKWLRNKLSPTASFFGDMMAGENAIGEPFEVGKASRDRMMPLVIGDIIELMQNDPQNAFTASVMNLFGASVQSYSLGSNWQSSTSKKLTAFKQKVGERAFNEANNMYNAKYKEAYLKIKDTKEYLNMKDEDQKSVIGRIRKDIQKKVLLTYGFKYKIDRRTKAETTRIKRMAGFAMKKRKVSDII